MPYEPRYIPEENTVFELTARTISGMLAFIPTPAIKKEWIGILSIACEKWPAVRVHQINVLSNHFHALTSVTGNNRVNTRGDWSSFVLAATARLAQRTFGIEGRVWAGRYRAIPVLDDAAIRDRVRYVMAQAVAANLVGKPNEWPGLSCADALCRGAVLEGYFTTAESRKRARRQGVSYEKTAERRRLVLAPLPSHTNWTENKRQAWYRRIERDIIAEERALQTQKPHRHPTHAQLQSTSPTQTVPLSRTPAPKAHVGRGNRMLYQAWVAAKRHFIMLWREALSRWVSGAPPTFPSGGWQPFVSCSKGLQKLQI